MKRNNQFRRDNSTKLISHSLFSNHIFDHSLTDKEERNMRIYDTLDMLNNIINHVDTVYIDFEEMSSISYSINIAELKEIN
jgi:hypothetical protein